MEVQFLPIRLHRFKTRRTRLLDLLPVAPWWDDGLMASLCRCGLCWDTSKLRYGKTLETSMFPRVQEFAMDCGVTQRDASDNHVAHELNSNQAFWNEIYLMCNECCAQVWEMLAPTTRWTAANQARRATELSACWELQKVLPSRELTYPPKMALLKMIFLFPRWDMLIPWRVVTKAELKTAGLRLVLGQAADIKAVILNRSR